MAARGVSLRSGSSDVCGAGGGFALIVVLWTLVLIAFLVAHLTATGRTEVRISGNLVSNGVSQAAADGAIFEAIFYLSDPQPQQRWPVDGNARELLVGNVRVLVRLEDEAWWINPNSAFARAPGITAARHRQRSRDRAASGKRNRRMGRFRPPAAEHAIGRIWRSGARLWAAGRAARDARRTRQGARHDSSRPRSDEAPSDAVWATRPKRRHDRSGRRGGTRQGCARRTSSLPGTAAPRCADDTATAFGSRGARVTRSAVVRTGAALPLGYQVLASSNGPNAGGNRAPAPLGGCGNENTISTLHPPSTNLGKARKARYGTMIEFIEPVRSSPPNQGTTALHRGDLLDLRHRRCPARWRHWPACRGVLDASS